MAAEVRYLWPAWLAAVLLPMPVVALAHDNYAQGIVIWLFFIGSASFVAYSFRRDIHQPSNEMPDRRRLWRNRMFSAAVGLFLAASVMSVVALLVYERNAIEMAFLAFSVLLPSLCVVPYLVLVTKNSAIAVLFSLSLVFCMKLAGCTVVVIVHGWDASAHGYTTMPWLHPNLLVWLFWINNCLLSLGFFLLGAKRFRTIGANSACEPA
jgi:hypothetical protein